MGYSYLAILDLGSNSTRMVVEKIASDGSYEEVTRVKEDTRLSEGMGPQKILQPKAIERVITALSKFQQLYQRYRDIQIIAIATAAVRQATNQKAFLAQVQAAIGVQVKVLSGDDEAYYDYLGATQALNLKNAILLDTGGASVELGLIREGHKEELISVPFGAVNLSEQFNLKDQVKSADLFRCARFIQKQYNDIAWFQSGRNLPIVLLGGANRTLARVDRTSQAMTRIQDFHGYRMTSERVLNWFERVLANNFQERQAIDGLEASRADIIVGGWLPLVMLINLLDSERVTFSESGVREGLITEFIQKTKVRS